MASELTDDSLSPDLPSPTMEEIRKWIGDAKRQGIEEGYAKARQQAEQIVTTLCASRDIAYAIRRMRPEVEK